MIKKANKITALLVAAAAVVSVVPASAVSAATKLGTKEGYFDNAVAFNGKYIYDGYKEDENGDEEDRAVYYNNGSKDAEVNEYDEEDYDFTGRTYGDKYIIALDGSDEYLVDLSTGKVTDDTLEDKKDDTAQALEKAIKKTDKFDGATVSASELQELTSYASFNAPYYYVVKDGKYIVTDENGKYVSLDKTANLYYYSSERDKVVKIENFNNDENADKKVDSNSKLGAELKSLDFLGQDKDYIYAIANVTITDASSKAVLDKVEGAKATVAIDFDKIWTAAKTGVTENAVVDLGVLSSDALNGTIAFDGVNYTTGAAADVANKVYKTGDVDSLIAAIKANAAADVTVTVDGKVVTVTAKNPSNTKVIDLGDLKAVTKYTAGIATADVTIEGVSTAAYTDAASYKAAVNAAMNGKAYAVGSDYFTYKNGVFTSISEKKFTSFTGLAGIADEFLNVTNEGTTEAESGSAASGNKVIENVHYLQKIAKAQGDKDDKAYLPKNVSSYLMDSKNVYDNGDVKDATDWILGNDSDYSGEIANVQVDGNSLYVYRVKNSDDKMKVLKIDLKSIKENPADTSVYGSSKLDGYVVKKDGDSDHDFDAYDVDSNGILWLLNDGYVVKYNKKDTTDVYRVDSGMDRLSVYDEKNLIAWAEDEDNKIYTTVTEGKKQTIDDGQEIEPSNPVTNAETKWEQQADGSWKYLENGTAATGWKFVGNAWYYMDPSTTIMATGWKNINGTWYYLNGSGAMLTGWQFLGGNWYYLDPVNTSGAMKTGWFTDTTGTWYYAYESGAMASNTTIGGYKLAASGAWVR